MFWGCFKDSSAFKVWSRSPTIDIQWGGMCLIVLFAQKVIWISILFILATTIDVNYVNPLYLLFKALKLKYLVGYSMDFFPLVVEFIVDWQIQRSVEAFLARAGPGLALAPGSRGQGQALAPGSPRAPRMLRRIVEFVNQRWIQQPMGRNPSNNQPNIWV